jgi:hypothetical protein
MWWRSRERRVVISIVRGRQSYDNFEPGEGHDSPLRSAQLLALATFGLRGLLTRSLRFAPRNLRQDLVHQVLFTSPEMVLLYHRLPPEWRQPYSPGFGPALTLMLWICAHDVCEQKSSDRV